MIGHSGLSQGELHVVQPKRALDQRISGLRMILIAISRVCGPVAKSASSSRQPLVLSRSSVLASAWTFFFRFRQSPLQKPS
jgi:hypothetical protein